MSTGDPRPRFEVYPPAAEAIEQPVPPEPTWEQPGVEPPVQRYQVTPYVPPPTPPRAGPSRRGVLGLVVAVPVVAVWLGSVNNSRTSSYGEDEETDDGYLSSDDTTAGGATMWIRDDTFELPDGWEATQISDAEAVATNGASRVQAYRFDADAADSAADLVSALVSRRLGAFKGDLGKPVDEVDGDVQRATVKGSGKLSGKAARLVGTLWIDADGNALLVVKIVTARKGSDIAQEAQAIVDELGASVG
nr:hypothetical protein [Propionicimonas sp.]